MFGLGDLFFTEALRRHQNGDWVNLGDEDWALNKALSKMRGARLRCITTAKA
jgi:hypothetical protein